MQHHHLSSTMVAMAVVALSSNNFCGSEGAAASLAATAPMVLYTDAVTSLTPGWCGNGAGDDQGTIAEITTDAFEGTTCLDFTFTTAGHGDDYYSYAALQINNLKGVDMTPYDTLKFAYKQSNTATVPVITIQFSDNSMPPDADQYTLPKSTAWKVFSLPLQHWKNNYGTKMTNVKALYMQAVNQGSGDMYLDDVSLVPAGYSASAVLNGTAPIAECPRKMTVAVTGRSIGFDVAAAGTVTISDLLGNQMAEFHAANDRAEFSWKAASTGAYIARYAGAGMVETQRLLVK